MINIENSLSGKPKYFVGFLQAAGVATYVLLFVTFVTTIGARFEHSEPFLAPLIFLMAFICSALICGSLALGYPIWLTVHGRMKEAIAIVVWSIAWLIIFILFAISVAVFIT